MVLRDPLLFGPLLHARGVDPATARARLSVLAATREGHAPPDLTVGGAAMPARAVDRWLGRTFWRWDFELPEGCACYGFGGVRHDVRLARRGDDLRMAFVSCNGKETGDFDRPADLREAMWDRLAAAHAAAPLSLLIQGGDQIYADAALQAHPDVARWADLPAHRRDEIDAGPAAERAVAEVFLDRWERSVTAPAAARLLAEVPSVAMWDDHDIFDGYGSHPAPVQESPVGRMIHDVARRAYRLFQAGGHDPARPGTLTLARALPGFTVIAPDLRSERRPDRVMGPEGWAATEAALAAAPPGEPVFLVSTVPALGPRLSLLEGLHRLVPGAQAYEDDLRDQWQSRAHRDEWRRFLALCARRAEAAGPVVFLSGEIHLAARAEMRTPSGAVLHQLIASGISHPPPPRGFARALGALGTLGGTPLAHHPIRFPGLPGGHPRYVAERNFLLLERRSGDWRAAWALERSGRTPWLDLHATREKMANGAPAAEAR